MPKTGLHFLMNKYPANDEKFIVKKRYRYIPDFKNIKTKTQIELELYEHNICILKFYDNKHRLSKDKYRLRSGIGPGHTHAIFKNCLEAFFSLEGEYALVFTASNDIGKNEEANKRFQSYSNFLSHQIKDFEKNYNFTGSQMLNTFMMYHRYKYKPVTEANKFLENFEQEITQHSG